MKHVKTQEETFVVELTRSEIFYLVERLKFQRELHNVSPDLSKGTWQGLEKLIGDVKLRQDLY